jgi:hypothetical protein
MANKNFQKVKTKFGGYGKYFSESCTKRFVGYMRKLRGVYRITYTQYQNGVGVSSEYMQGLEKGEKLLRRDMFIIDSCVRYFVEYHNSHEEFSKRGLIEFGDVKAEVLVLLRDNFDKQVIEFRGEYFRDDSIILESVFDADVQDDNDEMKLLF